MCDHANFVRHSAVFQGLEVSCIRPLVFAFSLEDNHLTLGAIAYMLCALMPIGSGRFSVE
jgi:hypothetical protein